MTAEQQNAPPRRSLSFAEHEPAAIVGRDDLESSTASDRSSQAVLLVHDGVETLEDVGLADVPAAVKRARRQKGFVWVQLVNPDERLVTEARETLGIHPVAAADVVSGRQQPKVQKFAEHLFVLLWQIVIERRVRATSRSGRHSSTSVTDGC